MPFVAFPRIVESAQALWEQRRAERDERQRERLQARWLVASRQVGSRSALARSLGRNREAVSRWLEDYARGGLETLLREPLPAGRPDRGGIGLSAPIQAAIRARLAAPAGERGYLALWRWAQAEHAIPYSSSHFHRWVHTHLGAGLQVARPSHAKRKNTSLPPSATPD